MNASKVCRILAFFGFWAIILPTFGGLGIGTIREMSKLPKEPPRSP